eukprot:1998131-Pyramimonas_sp.AAC.1
MRNSGGATGGCAGISARAEDTPGYRIDVRTGCAPRPIPATHFASSTTRLATLKRTTDTFRPPTT